MDFYFAESQRAARRQLEWERSFEGQRALEECKRQERLTLERMNAEAYARRGPHWREESTADFRNQQLICAIHNAGNRL